MGELKFARRDNKKYGTKYYYQKRGFTPKGEFRDYLEGKTGSSLSKGYRATNLEAMRYNRKMGGGNKRIFKNPRRGTRKISVR